LISNKTLDQEKWWKLNNYLVNRNSK
jgi:hypothetical protein